jgi:hypothetical protein
MGNDLAELCHLYFYHNRIVDFVLFGVKMQVLIGQVAWSYLVG